MNHHHHHHLLHHCGESTDLSGAGAPSPEEGPEKRGPQDVHGRGGELSARRLFKISTLFLASTGAGIWEELLAIGSHAGAAPSTVLSVPVTFLPRTHGQESLEREDRQTGTTVVTRWGEYHRVTLPSPCTVVKELGSSSLPIASLLYIYIYTYIF